jgi:ATP-dependent RNA helicase HelY
MQYRGLTLDGFQERAITALEAGHNVLVSAPTGTGKTIIADWIVEHALESGKQVIYTAPIKALSNQKFRDYVSLYGEERVGLVTGDMVIRRDAPCLVMTTEILRNILLTGEALPDLLAVVLDEIHFLDDPERGTVWEEVLIYLPRSVRIVGLSATLSNLQDLGDWLAAVREHPIEVVTEHERAVPLRFRYLSVQTGLVDPTRYEKLAGKASRTESPRGRGRGREREGGRGDRGRDAEGRKTGHVDVFRRLYEQDLLPCLYFVFSRRDTERMAKALFRSVSRERGSLLDDTQRAAVRERLDRAAQKLGPALDDDARELYLTGIAFHHAGLHVELKSLVEQLYEARLLKVLYCTSTFALGINMPARTVVFEGIEKYDGRQVAPLTTRGFMQKAGRAGRRGLDDEGHVVIRMDPWEYARWKPYLEKYSRAGYEPVRSAFNLSFHSIVHLVHRYPLERIREIVDRSFLSFCLERAARRAERTESTKRASTKSQRLLSRTWDEFLQKLGFLQQIGYVDSERGFNAGAKVLFHVQIAEVLVTELVLAGVFEDLDGPTTYGVMCGLTNSLPRHAHPRFRPTAEQKALARRIDQLRASRIVTASEEIAGSPYVWDPDVMVLGIEWARGVPLLELSGRLESDTDLTGDLVTGFRRAKDLVGQLCDVYKDDTDRVTVMRQVLRDVSRDEVEVVG